MAYNLADLFEHAVDTTPDRPAVICGEGRVTFRELDERVNRLAHHLAGQGIGKDDHIGVYAQNSIEAVEAMLAAYKLRAVAVSVNYRYVPDELRYLFDNADLVALVHQRRYADNVAAVLPDAPRLRHVLAVDDGSDADTAACGAVDYERALAAQPASRDFPARSADDTYILYTGGTTGYPKGVVWRHEDVWRALGGGIDFLSGEHLPDEWAQAERGREMPLVRLATPPLIHGAAQWAAFGALLSCSTVVFVPQFDAHEVWRAVQRHGVQTMTIVGDAMARPLMDAYLEGDYDASSLVSLNSHAALFSHGLKQQYLEHFPNIVITDAIGSSEGGFGGMGVVSKDADHSAGPRVSFGKDSILVDDEGREVPAEPGAVGRIARGGHVPRGYYKDPEKSRTIFVEVGGARYVVPGDYGRYEADGTLTLLGRGSQVINTGGEKVYPEEVEGAVRAHPDVYDALVVGVPDERFGQRVGAVVQPRAGAALDVAAVDELVRGALAGYKAPRGYWLTDAVQRQPSGKPDYAWAARHTEQHPPDAEPRAAAGSRS